MQKQIEVYCPARGSEIADQCCENIAFEDDRRLWNSPSSVSALLALPVVEQASSAIYAKHAEHAEQRHSAIFNSCAAWKTFVEPCGCTMSLVTQCRV